MVKRNKGREKKGTKKSNCFISLVHKKLIVSIISILLLAYSGALKDPNILKVIQTTCMKTNLIVEYLQN